MHVYRLVTNKPKYSTSLDVINQMVFTRLIYVNQVNALPKIRKTT